MLTLLRRGLHHPNGFVRKACTLALQAPRRVARHGARAADYADVPPVLADSFPKSGTHLLDQIVDALPGRRNYGAFLSSYTSSFQYRLRTEPGTVRFLQGIVPGEIVRAHLFHSDAAAQAIQANNVVHYFIYRDLRDVALSEASYLRSLNRWHRLHRYFRAAPTLADAITISIRGLPELAPRIHYPDIGRRFQDYCQWIGHEDVCAVKFEDLMSACRNDVLRSMASFYAARTSSAIDVDSVVAHMHANIDPLRSHTYRKGKSGGWREHFTAEHHRLIEQFAGRLLHEYGFCYKTATP